MLKKILAALFTAATCASAAAAPVTYDFSYTGANSDLGGPEMIWFSDFSLKGSFRGEDKDHNGAIDKSELEWLKLDYCWKSCDIYSFSYKPHGELEFDASYVDHSGDPYYSAYNFSNLSVYMAVAMIYNTSYYFTPDTKFTISAVPEPSTYAMMGVGLLGLAVAQRRRKKTA